MLLTTTFTYLMPAGVLSVPTVEPTIRNVSQSLFEFRVGGRGGDRVCGLAERVIDWWHSVSHCILVAFVSSTFFLKNWILVLFCATVPRRYIYPHSLCTYAHAHSHSPPNSSGLWTHSRSVCHTWLSKIICFCYLIVTHHTHLLTCPSIVLTLTFICVKREYL